MKKQRHRIKQPWTALANTVVGFVIGFILAVAFVFFYHGGDVIKNYNWSEKWNNCSGYRCKM